MLLSPDSGKSVRALLAAMDTIGRDRREARVARQSALGPAPRSAVQDRWPTISGSWRTTSATSPSGWPRARACSGQLTRDGGTDGALGSLGDATADFRVAMANLRAVTDRLKQGEGTVGALLEDPTVYENLVQFLEGARRSFLLRTLIRSTHRERGAAGQGLRRERRR